VAGKLLMQGVRRPEAEETTLNVRLSAVQTRNRKQRFTRGAGQAGRRDAARAAAVELDANQSQNGPAQAGFPFRTCRPEVTTTNRCRKMLL